MAKIIISGETFDYDGTKAPMSEALAVEQVYERRYGEWQQDLQAGGAKAFCVLAWIIWRRDGRDVPFGDIISGKADFDLQEMVMSMNEDEAAVPDPTPSPAPAGTPMTATATSPSSPASSTSARGRSGSSKSRTSRP
jgi:hypothetical protein